MSFADTEDRNSREPTPRLGNGSGSNSAPAARRPRKFFLLLIINQQLTIFLPAAPLNLANSPSLHLLTPAEQTLCSQLRIQPKPYLVIKETLVREYARRGGKLRRREARDLVKIDVNKTSRVWDFLVQSGYLKITTEPSAAAPSITPSVSQQEAKYVYIKSTSKPLTYYHILHLQCRTSNCEWLSPKGHPSAYATQTLHCTTSVNCLKQPKWIDVQFVIAVITTIVGDFE